MKKIVYVIIFLSLLILFTSCSRNSTLSITKRHYRNGFHIEHKRELARPGVKENNMTGKIVSIHKKNETGHSINEDAEFKKDDPGHSVAGKADHKKDERLNGFNDDARDQTIAFVRGGYKKKNSLTPKSNMADVQQVNFETQTMSDTGKNLPTSVSGGIRRPFKFVLAYNFNYCSCLAYCFANGWLGFGEFDLYFTGSCPGAIDLMVAKNNLRNFNPKDLKFPKLGKQFPIQESLFA